MRVNYKSKREVDDFIKKHPKMTEEDIPNIGFRKTGQGIKYQLSKIVKEFENEGKPQ
jgi:hypothetical protein